MFNKNNQFKRCPRCNLKTFKTAIRCGNCELNFEKFAKATNEEAKLALKKKERERILMSKTLPNDVNKWQLFILTLFLGWAGVHLWKVCKLNRAITHTIGLILGAIYFIIGILKIDSNFWYNFGNIAGVFWLLTFVMVFIDLINILFNTFAVPVSLPYDKNNEGD